MLAAIDAMPAALIPVAAVIEAQRVAGRNVEGVIVRHLEVEIADLVLIVHPTATGGHSRGFFL